MSYLYIQVNQNLLKMCWSLGASAVMAIVGFGVAAYGIRKKWDSFLWVPIIYFSFMELLQTITYPFIDQCSLPINQLLTFLGYIHISFQPFFINMLMLHFIPKNTRNKIQGYVFALCLVSTVLMLINLYPFSWAGTCPGGVFCGADLCSLTGSWHLGWSIPLNGLVILLYSYSFAVFLMPMVYGSWKASLCNAIIGTTTALLLAESPHEWPAVWCLFSIPCIVMAVSQYKKWLYVKKWYFWKYPWNDKN